MATMSDFAVGDIVRTHPVTDAWMQGLRTGVVKKVGRKYVHVDFFDSRIRKFSPHNLLPRGER
jgi:hypothetical protein